MPKSKQQKTLPDLSVPESEQVRGGAMGIDALATQPKPSGVDQVVHAPTGQTPPNPRPRRA